jgi:hypothetical protein
VKTTEILLCASESGDNNSVKNSNIENNQNSPNNNTNFSQVIDTFITNRITTQYEQQNDGSMNNTNDGQKIDGSHLLLMNYSCT